MQFAFTDEQELLRREAREVLANGGWARDDVAELGFLDRAVVFEEAGRANRGEEFFAADGPEPEQFVSLALEAVGIAAKALDLAVDYAKNREQFGKPIGVYQAVSHKLADTYVETELERSHAATAVSPQNAFAAATATGACSSPSATHHAAQYASERASSVSTYVSASLCETAW